MNEKSGNIDKQFRKRFSQHNEAFKSEYWEAFEKLSNSSASVVGSRSLLSKISSIVKLKGVLIVSAVLVTIGVLAIVIDRNDYSEIQHNQNSTVSKYAEDSHSLNETGSFEIASDKQSNIDNEEEIGQNLIEVGSIDSANNSAQQNDNSDMIPDLETEVPSDELMVGSKERNIFNKTNEISDELIGIESNSLINQESDYFKDTNFDSLNIAMIDTFREPTDSVSTVDPDESKTPVKLVEDSISNDSIINSGQPDPKSIKREIFMKGIAFDVGGGLSSFLSNTASNVLTYPSYTIGLSYDYMLSNNWRLSLNPSYLFSTNNSLQKSTINERFFIVKLTTTTTLKHKRLSYLNVPIRISYNINQSKNWISTGIAFRAFLFSGGNMNTSYESILETRTTSKDLRFLLYKGFKPIIPDFLLSYEYNISKSFTTGLNLQHGLTNSTYKAFFPGDQNHYSTTLLFNIRYFPYR